MLQENTKWILSTVLMVLVGVIPFLLTLTWKSLDYEIVSKSELFGEEFPIKDLELKIKGESVNKVVLYTFRIRNSGSEPIKKDDFEKPISINVPDDTMIYLARLKKKLPENLTPKYVINNNKLLIEPLLLNSDEEFEMELFSSSNEYPIIDARIVGISRIKKKVPDSEQYIENIVKLVLCYLLLVFYSKSGLLVFATRSFYSSNVSIRLGHGILWFVCILSFYLFGRSIADSINNRILFLCVSLSAVILGFLWALKEEKYNKTMQPISDTPPDS